MKKIFIAKVKRYKLNQELIRLAIQINLKDNHLSIPLLKENINSDKYSDKEVLGAIDDLKNKLYEKNNEGKAVATL